MKRWNNCPLSLSSTKLRLVNSFVTAKLSSPQYDQWSQTSRLQQQSLVDSIAASAAKVCAEPAVHASVILGILATMVLRHVDHCRDTKCGETDKHCFKISQGQHNNIEKQWWGHEQSKRKGADGDTIRTVHYRQNRDEPNTCEVIIQASKATYGQVEKLATKGRPYTP